MQSRNLGDNQIMVEVHTATVCLVYIGMLLKMALLF